MTTELPVVVAVDVSGSTRWVPNYYPCVNKLLENKNPLKVILWGERASFTDLSQLSGEEDYGHRNDTRIGHCLTLLNKVPEEAFHLVIATDGIVQDVKQSKRIMEENKLISKIQQVDIHFIGKTEDMNLEVNTIFDGIPQSIYINEKKHAGVRAHLDCHNLDLDEFLKDVYTAKATLIAKMPALTEQDKQLLVSKFRAYEKDYFRKAAQEKTARWQETISELYHQRDSVKFAEIVKGEAYQGSDEKKQLQSAIQACINLLTTHHQRSIYSLDHIQSIETDLTQLNTEDDHEKVHEEVREDELSEIECDILYQKCQNACMLVTAPTEPLLTQNLKKYADNPFYLMENVDVLQQLVKCVEHYVVDFETYNQLENKFQSPFTRQTLKTVFILHCGSEINIQHLMSHNGRAISILFGSENRLPGSLALWNVVFLYIMAKHHPVWSTHQDLLFNEIRSIASKASTLITFKRMISPNLITSLEIALWYCVEVSPIAFPNSNKNILRCFKRPLYAFYSDVFGKPKMDDLCLDRWEIWEYLVHRQSDPYLKAEILAQIQHHKVIQDKIVFFQGKCTSRFGFLKKFEVDEVLSLYTLLVSLKNKASIYENISTAKHHSFEVSLVSDFCLDELEHVQINIKTCQPFVICPITGKHWKDCAEPFQIGAESYYRMFRRYCIDREVYPTAPDDLLLFASERYFRAFKEFKIYNEIEVYGVLEDVMKKFKQVMQTFTCIEYLKVVENCQTEELRLQNE